MSIVKWIIAYASDAAFWSWVIFWGGAEILEGTFASGFLISIFAPKLDAEGLKLVGWFFLIGSTIWFLLGFVFPAMRPG